MAKKKQKFQSENPNNARVFVDYSGNQPKVTFDYVNKERGYFMPVVAPGFVLWVKISFVMSILVLINFSAVTAINASQYNSTQHNSTRVISTPFNPKDILPQIFIFDWFIMIPVVIAALIISNKKWLAFMPKLNYLESVFSFARSSYIVTFVPSQVVDNKVEIPLFRNIVLKYKAFGEMSKYLESVNIIEHPFNMMISATKTKPNEYLWKAIFTFKQTPRNGEIRCSFL